MKNKDVFAGIAAGGMSSRTDELMETLPMEKPTKLFSKTDEKIEIFRNKNYKEKLEDYYSGIEILKNRFKPFTIRKCGKEKTNRVTTYLSDFSFKFENSTDIEDVIIPHYTGPKGRWTAYYKTQFIVKKPNPDRRTFIVFKGVDYYADVYINSRFVCSHEGFFAPFECDITEFLDIKNKLTVKVRNDIPTIGNGDMQVNGDKLYAATGLGWDDPEEGWHHCPAGGGIFDKVYLEERDALYIDDVYVRPDIDNGTVEVNISVFSPNEENSEITVSGEIVSFNFEDSAIQKYNFKVLAGYGLNYYSVSIKMNEFRLWEVDSPYLYLCRASAESDIQEKTFGMRKFHMDEQSEIKGSLFLNNKPILLRGANEMGHLQLCVMRNDYDQLIEDILIARYCNMNYYRITQRPVQEEIYHYCDMLGMLNQADLPLFGYMRKNKFHEGVKQAGEMERLIRNHPSVIMATYINEPFAPDKYNLSYRHMSRPELELFFDACDAAVYFENPDRVIKRVEGDYDPPTNKGMSDFHCYNMWYTNHALPIGMLYKGYLPALKKGWKTGCGEYGAEGLDNYEVMRKYYPIEWLPEKDSDQWLPDKIIKSQTNTMHGDWYEAQSTIKDWISASQVHQAFATKLMTLAFRRRSDKIVSTAIHLLIDAWPSGWMKTLLDVDRVPKDAYFSFKESLELLKINLRSDRWSAYAGETINVESWILNDGKAMSKLCAVVGVYMDGRWVSGYSNEIDEISACSSKAQAIIPVKIPKMKEMSEITVQINLMIGHETVSHDTFYIDSYPVPTNNLQVYPIGEAAEILIESTSGLVLTEIDKADAYIISSTDEFKKHNIPDDCRKLFIIPEEDEKTYEIGSRTFRYKTIFDLEEVGENSELKGLSFATLSDNHKEHFHKNAFSYWYNSEKDYIDHVAEYFIEGEFSDCCVYGYEKPSWGKRTSGNKKKLPIAACTGNNSFMSFETKGRSGVNPALDKLITLLLTENDD